MRRQRREMKDTRGERSRRCVAVRLTMAAVFFYSCRRFRRRKREGGKEAQRAEERVTAAP